MIGEAVRRMLAGEDDVVFHYCKDAANAIASADRIDTSSVWQSWLWTKNTMDSAVAVLNIGSTGTHTINIWMREDGVQVDKLLLTVSSSYAPSGLGPPESPRSGTTTPTAPASRRTSMSAASATSRPCSARSSRARSTPRSPPSR